MREDLPPSYRIERDADLLVLRRPDGSVVVAFGTGIDTVEVFAAAWEDYE